MPRKTTRQSISPPLPPEIWTLVGENIQSRESLKSLIRTSKIFHAIFLPFLYARHNLHLVKCLDSWRTRCFPPGLRYVDRLDVFLAEFSRTGTAYNRALNNKLALYLKRILGEIKNLKSFSWLDRSSEDSYDTALILRNPNLLNALKGIETLENLFIQFDGFEEDAPGAENCWIPLKGFRNLSSLELYTVYIYDNEEQILTDIAQVLRASPSLKTLGLGLLCDQDDNPEAVVLGNYLDAFQSLSDMYASFDDALPLHLRTLRLGHGMCINDPSPYMFGFKSEDNFLPNLLALDGLETFHIYNGPVQDSFLQDPFLPCINWSLLHSNLCPSLRQLSISVLEEDVINWLQDGGKNVEELIVTHHYGRDNPDLGAFRKLPSSQLTMLYVREMDYNSEHRYWVDPDHSGAISSIIDSTKETVLDLLPDKGRNLRKLCLALDFETQWSGLAHRLPNLIHLTDLRIEGKTYRAGPTPTSQSSLWPNITSIPEIATRFAKLMSSMCPTLRYIKIGVFAWRVLAPIERGHATRSLPAVNLQRMDRDEIQGNALFAITNFAEQSGLSGSFDDTSWVPLWKAEEDM